jgi:hypothetical protein
VDLNGDGQADVISGSWPGEIYFFQRRDDGKFAAAETLKHRDGTPIKVGSASAVFAHDWNGNGRLDLVIGDIEGSVWLVSNEGDAKQPVWGEAKKLAAGGDDIRVSGGDAGPFVADWNGDGKADLVVGCGDGSVVWYRNIGEPGQPKLEAAKELVPAGSYSEGGKPGTRAKVCVVDYNGDGQLDLLVGDFGVSTSPRDDLTEEDKAAQQKLQAEVNELIQKYVKQQTAGQDEASAEMKALIERLSQVQRELAKYRPARHEYQGFVWLYERKQPGENPPQAGALPATQADK